MVAHDTGVVKYQSTFDVHCFDFLVGSCFGSVVLLTAEFVVNFKSGILANIAMNLLIAISKTVLSHCALISSKIPSTCAKISDSILTLSMVKRSMAVDLTGEESDDEQTKYKTRETPSRAAAQKL